MVTAAPAPQPASRSRRAAGRCPCTGTRSHQPSTASTAKIARLAHMGPVSFRLDLFATAAASCHWDRSQGRNGSPRKSSFSRVTAAGMQAINPTASTAAVCRPARWLKNR